MSLRNTLESLIIPNTTIKDPSEEYTCIRVFTSQRCEFSQIALEYVRSVIHSSRFYRSNIEVIEESIDENISILEDYNMMALPMTLIGDYYFLGIPKSQDLELVLNQVLCKQC